MTPTRAEPLRTVLENLPKHLLWRLVDRFERHDRALDADDEYVRLADLKAALAALPASEEPVAPFVRVREDCEAQRFNRWYDAWGLGTGGHYTPGQLRGVAWNAFCAGANPQPEPTGSAMSEQEMHWTWRLFFWAASWAAALWLRFQGTFRP